MRLNHVSLLVKDVQKSLSFYQDILGLKPIERPDLGFPGIWLGLEAGQSIHLMELPESLAILGIKSHPHHPGRDYHFALEVTDLKAIEDKLIYAKWWFRPSSSGRSALFTRDPDDNGLEFIKAKVF